MASEETFQAINKYAMGDRSKFNELKERFESMKDWSPVAAAALGYLIAKDELDAAEEEEAEPDVYDEVVEVIKKYSYPDGPISTHTTADEIFTLIYKWLDQGLASMSYPPSGWLREHVEEMFLPFIIEKPEA